MLKTCDSAEVSCTDEASAAAVRSRPRIALLSNPKSTGNVAQLPRIREFCADHPDIFHYEVEHADQVGQAMVAIARVRPKILVINGGDGTVQAVLTELHNGAQFGDEPPPVAVLPSGKTNLIALDLGVRGDPVAALEQLIQVARSDIRPYVVDRELIALRRGEGEDKPIIGMFLGGAGLADLMLYCRNKIYPLGLPNGLAHFLTMLAVLFKTFLGMKGDFLPPDTQPLRVSVRDEGNRLNGRFLLLAVTTLEKLLLATDLGVRREGTLRLFAIEERPATILRLVAARIGGKIGIANVRGVHIEEADEITIEGESSHVILDGETFHAEPGRPIFLRPAQPLSFVKLAA